MLILNIHYQNNAAGTRLLSIPSYRGWSTMPFDTQPFRSQYRANISPRYNPWLHAGFVLALGLTVLAFLISRLNHVSAAEWLTLPATLVFYSWGEYHIHKSLGHHKRRWGAMFYKRHTGDHHSFFAEGQMRYDYAKDWRVILFPAWLIVIYSVGALAAWALLRQVNANAATLFTATLLGGYLSYEICHACEHLPPENPISRLPWIRQMRRLHELHHRRELMQTHNFNIVFPLWDWLYGTLMWEDGRPGTVKMQHHIDVAVAPERILAYISTPARWPEWHPYHIAITAPEGTMPVGSRFEYLGGRAGKLQWEVTGSEPDRCWQTRALGRHGLEIRITYECSTATGGARVERKLEYSFSSPFFRLVDRLFLRKRIERDSVALLEKLRSMAELAPER